jgi:ABC-type xylose transport system permease subunit
MDAQANKVPVWYWAVAALATAWEAIGCFFYVMQVRMGPAELAQLPPAQANAFRGMAAWQWSVFAIAVWIGLVGAVALLLRRRLAVPALIVSLVGAIIQYGYTFAATPLLSTMPASEALPLPICIIVIGGFLVWFALAANRRGWPR